MIVNASPLILYGKINKIDFLCRIFPEIIISEEVYREVVVRGLEKKFPDALIVKSFVDEGKIKIKKLNKEFEKEANRLAEIYSSLDLREAQTIALVLQEKGKEVLIDEELARKVARLKGLVPYGSLRVILLAYHKKIIKKEEVLFILRELISAGLRVNAEVLDRFYELFEKMG